MRKNLFLAAGIVTLVMTLILAFSNIIYIQQYYIFFWTMNLSTTIMILLAAIMGFLVGFFAMLYSHEVRRMKEQQVDADEVSEAPAKTVEEQPIKKVTKEEAAAAADTFDDDDEVLG